MWKRMAARRKARNLSKLDGVQNEYDALPNHGRVFCCNSFKGSSLIEVTPGEFRKRQKLAYASGR